jgi:hypothetical protein
MKIVQKNKIQLQYAYGDDKKMPNVIFSAKDLENIVWENQEYLETQYFGKALVGAGVRGFLDLWQDFDECEDEHSFKDKNHFGPHHSAEIWHKLPNLIAKLSRDRV